MGPDIWPVAGLSGNELAGDRGQAALGFVIFAHLGAFRRVR